MLHIHLNTCTLHFKSLTYAQHFYPTHTNPEVALFCQLLSKHLVHNKIGNSLASSKEFCMSELNM